MMNSAARVIRVLAVALNLILLVWLTTEVLRLGPTPATLAEILFPLLNIIAVTWTGRPEPLF
jgi:hypothetical protein